MPVKSCLRCGIELKRRVRPSGNRESGAKYAARQHCSSVCRLGREPRTLPPPQPCARCGELARRGQKFCSRPCRDTSYVRVPQTEKQGRNQAQKRYQLQPCERCGTTDDIHRHHRDHNPLNNEPANISFFCAACHYAHHTETRLSLSPPRTP